jgi:hypothetical protein
MPNGKNRLKFNAEKKAEFLRQLALDGNVTRSANAIGIVPRTIYDHKYRDEKFKEDWIAAVAIGDEAMVDEARKRAFGGSDVLLMFMIKGRHPEYRDRPLIDVPKDSKFELVINIDPPENK